MSMPSYLTKVAHCPPEERSSWLRSVGPSYASLFLWLGFYQPLANGTIDHAGFGLLFAALLVAAGLSFALLYYVPAAMGRQTRYPLTVIASSAFGARGAWVVPGALATLLLTAWLGAALHFGARLILRGARLEPGPANALLAAAAAGLAVVACLTAVSGVRRVVALALPLSALGALVLAFLAVQARDGLMLRQVDEPANLSAVLRLVDMVMAYAATVCLFSPEFSMRGASDRDVVVGGVAGVVVPITYAGFLGILITAGGRVLDPAVLDEGFFGAAGAAGGALASVTDLLLAAGAVPAASVFCLLAGNNLAIILPKVGQRTGMLAIGGAAVLFAASGIAADISALASFSALLLAPVAGVITADFVRSGWRWPRTRPGISTAGFGAVALGLLMGLISSTYPAVQPASLLSYVVAFLGYLMLCNMGLAPYRKRVRRRR